MTHREQIVDNLKRKEKISVSQNELMKESNIKVRHGTDTSTDIERKGIEKNQKEYLPRLAWGSAKRSDNRIGRCSTKEIHIESI